MARHLHPVEQQAETGARLSIRFGDNGELDASITTAGLLAIGALVAGALLGSAAIVLAARRYGRPARSTPGADFAYRPRSNRSAGR